MVRPSNEGHARPLSDAETIAIGDGTDVGEDGIDLDNGGGTETGGSTATASRVVAFVPDSSAWDGVLDFAVASIWDITLTANLSAPTFANPPAAGVSGLMEVTYRQGPGGSFTLAHPSLVEWQDTDGTSGGSAPTMPTAEDAQLNVKYETRDAGTSYGGSYDSPGGSFSGDAGDVPASSSGYDNSDGTDVQGILDDFDAAITAAAGGGGGASLPDVKQVTSGFQNSSTSNAANLGSTPTQALICLVFGTSRGASSISQTNVTWTQRYTGNGNSQYFEVWTGAITGAAGTTVTANFASNTRSQIEVYELNHAALTTVGTPTTITSGGTTSAQLTLTSTNVDAGDIVVWGITCAGPSFQYGAASVPFVAANPFGGQGRGGLLLFAEPRISLWSSPNTSVAHFGAAMSIS